MDPTSQRFLWIEWNTKNFLGENYNFHNYGTNNLYAYEKS